MGRDMDERQRVIDYIRDEAEYIETGEGRITATRLLERFLFKGEDQYGLIGKLSGGEKRRLYLCRVLMSAPNVLILDEPTNDLDITTLAVLEDYLDHFDGIVIAVSHDRYFLDRVVRRIFAFQPDGRLMQSEGGYTDYENRMRALEDSVNDRVSNAGKGSYNSESTMKGDNRKAAEKDGGNRQHERKLRFSYKEQKEYETIEQDIAELEKKIADKEAEIGENASNSLLLQKLCEEQDALNAQMSEKLERWMYLEELAAKIAEQ